MMVNLFSYGTLQTEAVQMATFGRLLAGAPDGLRGYSLSMIPIGDPAVVATSGQSHHPMLTPSGSAADRVAGTVFQITEEELRHADDYEVDDYQRVEVSLESGLRAWVYVNAITAIKAGPPG
jgi:hypothetical protein